MGDESAETIELGHAACTDSRVGIQGLAVGLGSINFSVEEHLNDPLKLRNLLEV